MNLHSSPRLKPPYFYSIFLLLSIFILSVSSNALATVQFQDWITTEAEQLATTLKNQNAALTSEEISLSEKRSQEAMSARNFDMAINEYSKQVGKNPENPDKWLTLALAYRQKSITNGNWESTKLGKEAAIEAYKLAKDNNQQAQALLVYGSLLNVDDTYESPNYFDILQEIQTLTNLTELRKQKPEFADLMKFQLSKTRVNNQETPPSSCFAFSEPLQETDVQYQDFIEVTPQVPNMDVTVTGREVCLSPLKFGGTYDFIFKKGFPSALGEKTEDVIKTSLKIKDQDSRLSFSSRAYVLTSDDKASGENLIPLSGVNVDSVSLKVLRVNDRDLNQILGSSQYFLTDIWSYAFDQLENIQGEPIWQGEMAFSNKKNITETLQIPFSKIVKTVKPGVYLISAEEKSVVYGNKASANQWLVVSDLGLTTFSSPEEGVLVNVRSLKTASPLANVEVQLLAYNNTILGKVKTSQNGIAKFGPELTRGKGGNRPIAILAYAGNSANASTNASTNANTNNNSANSQNTNKSNNAKGDFNLLTLDQSPFDLSDRGVSGRKIPGPLDIFLYSEQGVYRPGDKVHLNALLRDEKGIAKGDLPITFKLLRPDSFEVGRYVEKGNKLGFYELTLPIASSARTGQWTLLAYTDIKKDPIGTLNFSVEDFVPSRVLVSLKSESKFLTPDQPITVQVEGRYLFGAKTPNMEGEAYLGLRAMQNPYPNLPGYTFGIVDDAFTPTQSPLEFQPLDDQGKGNFEVALNNVPDTSLPLEAMIRVTLLDKGGRPEMGVLKIPVYLNAFQIGIKSLIPGGTASDTDNKANFEVVTVTPEGKLNTIQNLEYQLFLEEPQYTWFKAQNGSWNYKTTLNDKFLSKGTFSTDEKAATPLSVTLADFGSYRLEIQDPQTQITSSIRFYKGWRTSTEAETPDQLNVTTNKDTYKPGETVEMQIDSPFEGQALLTFANSKVIETKNIKLNKNTNRIKFQTQESYGTGVYCLISAFRPLKDNKNTESKSYLPKRAVGLAWIGTNPENRTLDIQFTVPNEVLPNQTIDIPIQVKNASSSPTADSRSSKSNQILLTVSAVDEGILKLTDFKTPDPTRYFFGKRTLGVELRDLYGNLINPLDGPVGILKTGGDMGALSRNLQALSKRSFKIVSLYNGLVDVDKAGRGIVKLNLPDFNGSLRLMAVALDEKRVGSVEQSLLVRDPVVVEGVLPRFLAPNDKSFLTVSLHNVSGESGDYFVTVKGNSVLSVQNPEDSQNKVTLEKEATKYLSIPIQANQLGEGQLRLLLTGPGLNITKTFDISIRSPNPYRTQSENQVLKSQDSTTLSKTIADNFVTGTEEIQASWSTSVPWNTDRLKKDLANYGYGCVEQTTSKGIGALYSVSKIQSGTNSASNSDSDKTANKFHEVVNQAIARLSELQTSDGGFSLWPNNPNDPWLTAYATDFLIRAQSQHYRVPQFTLENALKWLESYASRVNDNILTLQTGAYALYVLSKQNRIESGSIRYFYDTYFDKLPDSFSRALIAAALAERGDVSRTQNAFKNALNTDKNAAQLEDSNRAPYGSLIRDRAGIILFANEALSKFSQNEEPELKAELNTLIQSLIPALGNDINSQQYLSTQEEAWAIMTAEALTPASTSGQKSIRIKLTPQDQTSTQPITPEVTSSEPVSLSSAELKAGVLVKNEGESAVYQHLMASGILKKPEKATQVGLEISREYYTLDGKESTASNLKQGTQLVVVLKGKATNPIPQRLLMIDMLPAGFEIENARLQPEGVTLRFPWIKKISTALFIEARDDKYVAALNLSSSEREFTLVYIVRAVSKGTYVHPGFFVEDMYAPKFYARTADSTVQISE